MPSLTITNRGGPEGERGKVWECHSLVLYLLLRRVEHPEAQITFEPTQGEDAKIEYPLPSGGRITEFIQCKKREDRASGNSPSVDRQDLWEPGEFRAADLSGWVTRRRPQSVEALLQGHNDRFYTALVFGRGLESYAPQVFREPTRWLFNADTFSTDFPIAFQHPADPGGSFATANVRRRVRVLALDAPGALRAHIRWVLEQAPYGVRPSRSDAVYRVLLAHARLLSSRRVEENRLWAPAEIDTHVQEGRAPGRGLWRDMRALLQSPSLHPSTWDSPLSWDDFVAGRFLATPGLEDAATAFGHNNMIVVQGHPGVGKTAVCRYLAWRYLSEQNGRRAYYISASHLGEPRDETAFLEAEIRNPVLFVIDDQARAPDSVEMLVRKFIEASDGGVENARLVVTSTLRFSQTQAWAKDRRRTDLNFFAQVWLRHLPAPQLASLLEEHRRRWTLPSPLLPHQLATLSDGNPGLALLLARAASDDNPSFAAYSFYERRELLRNRLRDWIIKRLNTADDREFWLKQVVPVFILGSFGVPIPADFTGAVRALARAEFLEPDGVDVESAESFVPPSIALAEMIREQHPELEDSTLSRFLAESRAGASARVVTLFERLSSRRARNTLKRLCKNAANGVRELPVTAEPPLSLGGLAKILGTVYFADRALARQMLASLTAPGGKATPRFFFGVSQRAQDALEASLFLETALRLDRFGMRTLAAQLGGPAGDRTVRVLATLFAQPRSPLDEIGLAVHSLRRCSREAAAALWSQLKVDGTLQQKALEADVHPDAVSAHVRFAEHIRFVARSEAQQHLATYVPKIRLVDHVTHHEAEPFSRLLFRLHRINPRFVSELTTDLWERNRTWVEGIFLREHRLGSFCNSLYSLSRIDHRIAIRVAAATQLHLIGMLRQADSCRSLGSTLRAVRGAVSTHFAEGVASELDRTRVRELLDLEIKPAIVGRFLSTLAELDPDQAGEIALSLEWKAFLFSRPVDLRDLAFFVTGLLFTARVNGRGELTSEVAEDLDVQGAFRRAWKRNESTAEAALALMLLLKIPLSRRDLWTLLGFPSEDALDAALLQLLNDEASARHFSSLLFVVGLYKLPLAAEALRNYAEDLEEDQRRNPSAESDLVEIGELLHVAAAVDASVAAHIAALQPMEALIGLAVNDSSVGRVGDFIAGLHRASWRLARDFVDRISDPEVWEDQFLDNENPNAVVNFARELRSASMRQSHDYVAFIVRTFKSDIEAMLANEQNSMVVTQWLRTIRGDTPEVTAHRVAVVRILHDRTEHDRRVRHLLEAGQALAEIQHPSAVSMLLSALQEAAQLRGISRIEDFLDVALRATSLAATLEFDDFPERLLRAVPADELASMLRHGTPPVLVAFAFHYFESWVSDALADSDEVLRLSSADVMAAVRADGYAPTRFIGLAFMGEAPDTADEARRAFVEAPLWLRGLATLAVDLVGVGTREALAAPLLEDGEVGRLAMELTDNTINAEYALTLYLVTRSGVPHDSVAPFAASAAIRSTDEANSPVKRLLDGSGETGNAANPYSVWRLLQATVLRASFLPFLQVLEDRADHERYRDGDAR